MRLIRICLVISVVLIFCSCSKEDDFPDSQITTDLSLQLISGNNQSGCPFQELENDIIITIKDKKNDPYRSASFKFTTGEGNGLVCGRSGNAPGEYRFRWLLSCNEGNQNASIMAYDSQNRIISTLDLSAASRKCETWNLACGLPVDSCTFTFNQIRAIKKHPDNRLFLLSSSPEELYSSADQGASWSSFYKFDTDDFGVFLNIRILEDGHFYLSSEKGLFKSMDGMNWVKLIDYHIKHYYTLDHERIIVDTEHCGRFLTDNNGQTWSQINSAPELTKIVRIGSNTFCAINNEGYEGAYISEDNGTSWRKLDSTSSFIDIIDLEFHDDYLYLINLSGQNFIPAIYKSPVSNWNWTKFTELTSVPHNSPSRGILKFYNGKAYAHIDRHLYKIESSGETESITEDVLQKLSSISTIEISSGGNVMIGSDAGGQPFGGVYYKNLN